MNLKMMNLLSEIKKIIPEYTKQQIKLLFISSSNPKWLRFSNVEKRIFVFLAGFYQNLGDLAITYAHVCFLQDLFPDFTIVCIPSGETYSSVKTLRKIIKERDLITIVGGGNMDDEYSSLELARLYVIKNFPNNKIVSFPQTIHYSNSPAGEKLCNKGKKIYQKHKNLEIFVREHGSLERIKYFFPDVKATLCPDIVFSLDKRKPYMDRHGVVCCLRSDKERLVDSDIIDRLIEEIKYSYDDVYVADTVDITSEQCREEYYEKSLNNYWNLIKESKVVLTDRLHGMIFCVITATPCVVLDNSNHKISEVYDTWLKENQNIKLIRNYSHTDILDSLKKMYLCNYTYDNSQIKEFNFDELKRACISAFEI